MKVGELRRALEGVRDDLDVIIDIPQYAVPDPPKPDWAFHTKRALVVPQSSINNEEFSIEAGEGFAY